MILKETLKEIVKSQNEELFYSDLGVGRDISKNLDLKSNHALIITGIRRCGKSTLLKQIIKKTDSKNHLDFEDPRLSSFEVSDFEKLNEVFEELYGKQNLYFFDEVQNIDGWERFVRKMQDLGKKFFITGSNASMLSKELGTKLTGRHLSYELFPFSYNEWLRFTKKKASINTFEDYLSDGGFPEYAKYKNPEILRQISNDVVLRDIAIRHKLKDVKLIRDLTTYLLSNIGKEVSFNKLKTLLNLGSTNTVSSYIHHLEESYLLFAINKFDYSYKKQLVNPKKIYAIDTGFARMNSVSFSKDKGRMLENCVFLHFRRKNNEIYYFKGKNECDFLIKHNEKIVKAIQICLELNEDNKDREILGLKEAMEKFNLKKGLILTFNQKEKIGNIELIPAWEFLSKTYLI